MGSRLPSILTPPIGFAVLPAGGAERSTESVATWARESLAHGATGVTSPVRATADGIAVLATVGKVGGRLRRKAISEVTAAELGPEVAPLAALTDHVGAEMALALEPHDERAMAAVVALVEERGPDLAQRVWIRHPDLQLLTEWRSRTATRLVHTTRLKSLEGGLERWTAELEQRAIDGLCLPHSEWSGGRVALLHRFHRLALARGVTFQREAAKAVDIGIDGLSSDRVADLMAVIHEFHGGPTDR